MFEELEDQNSPLVNFINSFTFNHIISSLDETNRQQFIDLLERENNDDKVWQFVKENIANFEENYEKELEKRLRKIKTQVLSGNKLN